MLDLIQKSLKRKEEKAIKQLSKFAKNELAVLLIDMQLHFISKLRSGEDERIVPNQIAVLRYCAKNNIPVIMLEYENRGRTILVLLREAIKTKNIMFKKSKHSGFTNAELNPYLKGKGIKTLFFMGINADCCVRDTAKDAISLKYNIVTSNDVIAGRPEHSKNNNVPWYKRKGIYLRSVESFFMVSFKG